METIWLMKHVGRYNAMGRQLRRRNYWNDSKCPRCHRNNEDSDHIIMCPHVSATEELADHIYELESSLQRLHTHPSIATTLLNTLYDRGNSSFETNLPTLQNMDDTDMFQVLTQAAKEQDSIQFSYIFEGHIIKK